MLSNVKFHPDRNELTINLLETQHKTIEDCNKG